MTKQSNSVPPEGDDQSLEDDDRFSPLGQLVNEYTNRLLAGESLAEDEFIARHPEFKTQLQKLLPTIQLLGVGPLDAASDTHKSPPTGPSAMPTVGSVLGDYCLTEIVGRGGMGVVYRAQHLLLGHEVAVKVLQGASTRPKLRERFLREASAAASMDHPNIIKVFEFASDGDALFFSMQLIDGRTLSDVAACLSASEDSSLENATSPNGSAATTKVDSQFVQYYPGRDYPGRDDDQFPSWVASVGVQASDALAYAHRRGVVHRDIKPANLLLDSKGTVFVADFGLASIAQAPDLTATGDLLGTLRYLPPESMMGRVDHRGDIYALGLTLYELLAGQAAFSSSNRAQLLKSISSGNLAPLAKRCPTVPHDLVSVIEKSIDVDATERYQSADQLRDDLKRFLLGQPVSAIRAGVVKRSLAWTKRNKTVSILGGAIAVILLLVAVSSLLIAGRYASIARDNEVQTEAARAGAAAAALQTRNAQLNLLRSNLSDARGWSTSSQPGQRSAGLKSLSEAIQLARKLKISSQYKQDFDELLVALLALHDAPVVQRWPQVPSNHNYDSHAFSGNLSELAFISDDGDCEIYRTGKDQLEHVESVEAGLSRWNPLRFSNDGRIIATLRQTEGNVEAWIYDRQAKRHHRVPSGIDRICDLQILPDSDRVAIINDTPELVVYRISTEQVEIRAPLSKERKWNLLSIDAKGRFAAICEKYTRHVLLADLITGLTRKLDFRDGAIYTLAWRPDGRQLAIACKQLFIWDIERDKRVIIINQTNKHPNRLAYSGDGRLLLSSGWQHRTEVHDALAEKRVMLCDAHLNRTSADGRRVAMTYSGSVEIRDLITSEVVKEVNYSRIGRSFQTALNCDTGLLWIAQHTYLSTPGRMTIFDFVTDRVKRILPSDSHDTHVCADPHGRDLFASLGHEVHRIPIKIENVGNGRATDTPNPTKKLPAKRVTIGPPSTIFSCPSEGLTTSNLCISGNGEHLGFTLYNSNLVYVVSRKPQWNVSSHFRTNHDANAAAPHPTLPLVATSVHHDIGPEVRDYRSSQVKFRYEHNQCNARFSPSGDRLAIHSTNGIDLFRTSDWKRIARSKRTLFAQDNPPTFSSDGRYIASQAVRPHGVVILDGQTLRPRLLFPANHLDPDSYTGCIDPKGRFLVANRGLTTIGIWDLHALREGFAKFGLDWPLDGLGNPAKLRSDSTPIDVIWEPTSFLQTLNQKVKDTLRWLPSADKTSTLPALMRE